MSNKARVLLPGARLGLLGGGQLGRMTALAARAMGYRIWTLDPQPDCPCAQVADHQLQASFADDAAARELARACDVVAYEFENVDLRLAQTIEQHGYLPQGSHLLAVTQQRLREKHAVAAAGVPVTAFRAVRTRRDLAAALAELGLPCVLKTTRGGYDGKGQWLLRSTADAARVPDAVFHGDAAVEPAGESDTALEAPLVAEAFVPFVAEVSVVVARTAQGDVVSFPPAENVHQDGILRFSIVPARLPQEVLRRAQKAAERVAVALDAVGLLAVEMFVTADGRVWFNELAPRPHNSGHYTQDACSTSQFEQFVRALCGLRLASPRLLSPVVMANILGEHLPAVMRHLPAWPGDAKLHLYGKAEAKPGRKMGHVNVLAPRLEEALELLRTLQVWGPLDLPAPRLSS
ncbi:MAG: 5-(carboxyamino)imidazole ribonucleotide synthase [Alicyclobacillus sp.]|nr:5-(carboxyamino)imidazole ribonucleotide synthase [Alicyclobacillus sp.]